MYIVILYSMVLGLEAVESTRKCVFNLFNIDVHLSTVYIIDTNVNIVVNWIV